ncbi:MAG TPA: FAD-dependent tricarballylate dehydrogenase TcuA [Bryobacteraceae bacterium]|jgi:tricarballylate dehydrogenase|nr:FAD-dependent tricarballylate dehydrogenase TcuA [Bryobacteraceae bacterium]
MLIPLKTIPDVLVIGGGNAGLCAALSARDRGASVTILESAPVHYRAGNSRHTRNMRVLGDAYPEPEYFDDLLRVTGGETNQDLARLTIRSSRESKTWMLHLGVRFQPSLGGTLHLDRTNAFFLGGGKALMNTYYQAAEAAGIKVFYNTEVTGLNIHNGHFESATARSDGRPAEFRGKSVVIASGGFESNIEWLKEAWGDAADNFLIRGTPYNKGKVLRLLLDNGAAPVGDAKQCHAVAIDARAPKFDGGIVTRLDCLPLGIVVNKHARRFYDEGEDLWPKRYAIWGRLVAQQPDQIAWSIIDSKVTGKFMPSVFPAIRANTIRELADTLGLDPDALDATVNGFNHSVVAGSFDHTVLDDCATLNLTPPKSHWAQRIDAPPFLAYPLRPGITFTYLGVKVDAESRLLMNDATPAKNMFAAGEIMAGNILGKGYLAGFGMTIGTVFGRIAGHIAAKEGTAKEGAAGAAR